MRRMWFVSAIACAVFAGTVSPALGQDSDDKARAQQHYAAGVQAYNIGDFDVAIKEWKEGYRLHDAPDFLFNIAQAYRGKADYENAIFFVNAFLREKPNAPNADEVKAVLAELEKLLAEAQAAKPESGTGGTDTGTGGTDTGTGTGTGGTSNTANAATPPTTGLQTAGTGSPSPTPRDEPAPVGKSLKVAGLVAGGTGIALIVTGVVFSVSASNTESDLEAAAESGEPWTPQLEDKEASGERNATLGVVFAAGGAAAVVGGVVAYTLGWRKARASQSGVSVTPTARGAQVTVRFDF